MILKRRETPTWTEHLRVSLWPRRSWARSLRYVYLRLVRMRAAPHKVALGCAIGVFASVTPLFGFQMLLAGFLAIVLRANFASAMLGTFFGNPLTWPVIWAATYSAGCVILSIPTGLKLDTFYQNVAQFIDALTRLSLDTIIAAWNVLWPFVYPMLIGSLPIGFAAACAFYYVSQRAASSYASRRAKRLKAGLQAAF
ncbi:MAG: DUF2062 domain-containing protein [Hyphomicrobiaceae bacterium]